MIRAGRLMPAAAATFGTEPYAAIAPQTINYAVTSNVEPTSARISVNATGPVRLVYSDVADFSRWRFTDALPATGWGGHCVADLNGLPAGTTIYYSPTTGTGPSALVYEFKTPASGAHSFSFLISACHGNNSPVLTKMAALKRAFYVQLGDLHYSDPTNASEVVNHVVSTLNGGSSGPFRDLLKTTPIEWLPDDHDLFEFWSRDTPDNGPLTNEQKLAMKQAYRDMIGLHRPLELPDANALYHSFDIGRVRIIMTDCRSRQSASAFDFVNDGTGEQEVWMKAKALEAKQQGKISILTAGTAWTYGSGDSVGAWHNTVQRICKYFYDNAIPAVLIGGDNHYIGMDDGLTQHAGYPAFNTWGVPTICVGAIGSPAFKPGNYYLGGVEAKFHNAEQFLDIHVTDNALTAFPALSFEAKRRNPDTDSLETLAIFNY